MTLRLCHSVMMILLLTFCTQRAVAQFDKITIDLQKDKPEKFQNRQLKSEKTGDKKFTLPRRFVQNTVSHYNFYFNASNKISSVIENARLSQQDDYNKLLPYYSYSLDNTTSQKNELDSVIQKATAGILLHDLRSDWVDNFYLLIGKSYYFQKEFDSAYMAFQFINYNLHPKNRKNQDEQKTVGSTDNQVAGALSIANKEDRNLLKKTFSMPPSRNDALVWQVRTLTDMGLYAEAAGLINTLKNDPNFPERLDNYLDEVEGYWFFQQHMYDSAIQYIELSMPNAIDLQDQARREFLLAQLYENKGSVDTSYAYYSLVIRHTTNPLMDIYANLNQAKLLHSDEPDEIRNSVQHLLKMARKDKYHDYRHIIYFAAGELAMNIPDSMAAMNFYNKSTHFNQNDVTLKNKAFLNLADMSYERKEYRDAYNYYDSLQTGDTVLGDLTIINEKKSALAKIIGDINIISREDSLQMIAALPTADREAFLKKLSRKLRKERGIKDDDYVSENASDVFKNKNESIDLFSANNTKGEWYFYNTGMKSKGYNDFKREWNNRQNVDNWRRASAPAVPVMSRRSPRDQANMAPDSDPMAPLPALPPEPVTIDLNMPVQEDVSVDGLKANLPLTQPLLDTSNEKIAKATFALGKNYQTLLEDYKAAIETYENSLKRFPDSLYGGELYMNLSYCYKQLGDMVMAVKYQNLLTQNFAASQYADIVLHPEKYDPNVQDTLGTKIYNDIYTKFIEGDFQQALEDKKAADSLYGKTHWNPQLLYIESVYYIKQREDSTAISTLKQIVQEYPGSAMQEKAENIIRVLGKRDSIENYLTNLKVVRIPEDSEIVVFNDTRIYGNMPQKLERNDSNLIPRKITTVDVPEITAEKKLPGPLKNKNFVLDPYASQNVVMVMTKVDPVYSSEARTAFIRYTKTKFYNREIDIIKDTLDAERTLLVFSGFVSAEDALKFLDKIKQDAAGEISWLPANKYAFYIISDDNLDLLKENKKLDSYLDLLREKFPGKF